MNEYMKHKGINDEKTPKPACGAHIQDQMETELFESTALSYLLTLRTYCFLTVLKYKTRPSPTTLSRCWDLGLFLG